MENNPREIELNFSSENDMAELEAARSELSSELEKTESFQNESAAEWSTEEKPDAFQPDREPVAEASGDSAGDEKNVAEPDSPVLLRSRYPVNRPAGTPPLNDSPARENMSVLETTLAGKSYGIALKMLREQHGVSWKDLEQVTLIQSRYLEALENEDLKNLPPLVYVIGYIRSLCRFYKVTSVTSDAMVAQLKEQLEYSCKNEQLINSLEVDRSGAEANERQLKKIMMSAAGGLLLLVLLVGAVVMLCNADWSKNTGEIKGNEQKFDPNSIYSLLEPATMELPKIPVAE